MKPLLFALALAASPFPLIAVQSGDSLEAVVAEKGQPANRLQAGATTILVYRDSSIKIQDGKVVAIKSARELAAANVMGTPPAASHPAPAVRSAPTSSEGWTTDYPAALTQARSEGKQVFILFTGSDWCIWCKRLEGEILSTPEFREYAAGKLILVKLDFPKSTPQSDQLKAQNRQLAAQNGIRGYPTVIILDSSGKRIGQLGYVKGGPSGFIQTLQSL